MEDPDVSSGKEFHLDMMDIMLRCVMVFKKHFLLTVLNSFILANRSYSLSNTGTVAKFAGNSMALEKSQSRTFYQRPLPETCTAFASPKGKTFFRSAMDHGGLKSFYLLIEQHSTQTEPAYCGLSTLVIVLNALAVDPRQIWKGPWRWYEETMLNCCIDLEDVKQTGITLKQFNCLAKCQGLVSELYYVDQDDAEQDHNELSGVDRFRAKVQQACVEELDARNCDDSPQSLLVVSYSRKVLGQTGSGHFSPIAAYDEVSDHVLVLDTARFKYGTHWIPLKLLYEAMKPIDPDTKRSRGYAILHAPESDNARSVASTGNHQLSQIQQPLLLHLPQKQKNARLQFKTFLKNLSQTPTMNEPTLRDVLHFFSRNENEVLSVWNLTEVQLRPLSDTDPDGSARNVMNLMLNMLDRLLLHHVGAEEEALVQGLDACNEIQRNINGDCDAVCRPNFGRSIAITAPQAMFLFYLAAVPESRREEIVDVLGSGYYGGGDSVEQIARLQLLVEADFLRIAIDMSDSDEL